MRVPGPQGGGGTGLVARPIFKIASEVPQAAPVGSIPTRSRHLVLAVGMLTAMAAPLSAQDTLAVVADTAAAVTAIRGPSPTGALVKSLLLPGLGQITLGRKLTAGFFIAAEAGTVAMALRAHNDARAATQLGDSSAADAARQRREDWLVLMGVNHVLSGLEAYVSAHLFDFPRDLDIRLVPDGVGFRSSLPAFTR